MSLFGAIVRTIVNTATLPVAVLKDAGTLGGTMNDRDSYIVEALERLKKEAESK